MATNKQTISENRFSVEIDGISAFKATKVGGGTEKHQPVKTKVGNDPYPLLGRGNVEPEDVTITIPSGIYDAAIRELGQWVDQYFDGSAVVPKSGRVIVYDETGRTPVETWEIRDAVPMELKRDDLSGDGTGAATCTLTITPYKYRRI